MSKINILSDITLWYMYVPRSVQLYALYKLTILANILNNKLITIITMKIMSCSYFAPCTIEFTINDFSN